MRNRPTGSNLRYKHSCSQTCGKGAQNTRIARRFKGTKSQLFQWSLVNSIAKYTIIWRHLCLCGSVEASVMEGSGRLGNKSRPCFVFETNKFGGKITNMKLWYKETSWINRRLWRFCGPKLKDWKNNVEPFLDALASLDLKLSVSEWVIYRFQLAHLRVFQIIFLATLI